MPPVQETGIQWNKVTWYSKTLAVLLFVILVCGAFYFGTWYQTQKISSATTPTQAAVQQTSSYKHAYYGDIPSTWSTYANGEAENGGHPAQTLQDLTSPLTLAYSFSPNGINFGDGAFSQVDFYYLTKAAAQSLVDQATKEGDKITTGTVGGFTSTIINYPTDNGQIDKNGSGGTDYLVGYPEAPMNSYLLMRKWSLGNQEFESGFQYYLQTAEFQSEG